MLDAAYAIGALAALAAVSPLLAWLRWRLGIQARRIEAAEARSRRLFECLLSAPDGFYAWMADGGEVCSRRLAVLLRLPGGAESTFGDVVEALDPGAGIGLARAVEALCADGTSFTMELPMAESERRVRASAMRVAAADGEMLADIVWMRDVTEDAAVVEDLTRSLQALATDTAHLKELLDVLPMPVWLRDDDLSILYVNRAYARAVEADGPEAVVAAQIELASEGQVREARALAARARAAHEPRTESFHLVLGGQRRLALVAEVPVTAGQRLLTAGFAQDETRTEELRSELDHHVTAHAEVLERLSTAIAIYSTDTRLAFFNTAFMRLWRLERDWLETGPTYGAVLDMMRERRLLPETADYRASKEMELKRFIALIEPVETVLHLPDGRTLRRLISPHPYGGLIFTYEDVTDTLALERSFNTMLAVQRETLDHLHEGVAVWGGDGRLKLSNPAFERIWDLSANDLAGEPHAADLIERHAPFFEGRPGRASDWPAAKRRLLDLFKGHTPFEGRFERQDGSVLDCMSVPLPDGALLVTWLDVSDSARVERALRERNEALAAADMLKSEFIANVSAEVAKPLTTIIGFSEMLSSEYLGKLSKRQGEYCRGIVQAGTQLAGLIADILDLASIEAGTMTLELDSVDIQPMLAGVLALMKERVREKKIQVEFDCPPDIGWIVADERRLRQVMFSLAGNAVKFSPPGGRVVLSVERKEGEVVMRLVDSGPGIPAEDQARVFDAFVSRPAAGGEQTGAGLGLALVRRFVELHGGRVELASTPGEGTTVTVRLPASGEG